MLLLMFQLLLVGYVAFASDCTMDAAEPCHKPGEPELIPETVEELDAFCEFAIPFYNCAIEKSSEKSCGDSLYKQYVVSALPLVTDVCQKNSSLYEEVSAGLPCFGEHQVEILKDPEEKEYNKEEFLALISSEGIDGFSEDDEITHNCLRNLFKASRWSMKFSKFCGTASQGAFEEVMQRMKFPIGGCTDERLSKYPSIVRTLEENISVL